jgi:tRNA1Val (adenine37-N6)-methyltransferase
MFQFKQFTIHQENCAMKVTEIACIQGAYTPIATTAKTGLDIGSGTGLLSLMLAQRFSQIEIDAIEIDDKSFLQGKENIQASPFSAKINCLLADVTQYLFTKKYDFIIVNPPFFENQLKSPNAIKNKAWHSTELTLEKLIIVIKNNLAQNGSCYILLPIERKNDLEQLMNANNLFLNQCLMIQPNEKLHVKYFIALISFQANELFSEELIIKEKGVYTARTNTLFKDFYLKL